MWLALQRYGGCDLAIWQMKTGRVGSKIDLRMPQPLIWGQCGAHTAYVHTAYVHTPHCKHCTVRCIQLELVFVYLCLYICVFMYLCICAFVFVHSTDASAQVMRVRSLADLFSRSCSFQSIYRPTEQLWALYSLSSSEHSTHWAALPTIRVNLHELHAIYAIHIEHHHFMYNSTNTTPDKYNTREREWMRCVISYIEFVMCISMSIFVYLYICMFVYLCLCISTPSTLWENGCAAIISYIECVMFCKRVYQPSTFDRQWSTFKCWSSQTFEWSSQVTNFWFCLHIVLKLPISD